MSDDARYCPECEKQTAELLCPADGTQTVSEASFHPEGGRDPLIGRVFASRYRIDAILGEGGMGRVYEATQLSMGRSMALKMLHPDLAKTREYVRRFYREAKAASGLDSPHVVRIFDFGLDDDTGRSFMAMELLKGTDLGDHLEAHGAMPVRRACDILAQTGRALIEAHAAGLVHRDLKPDNIQLQRTSDGADFVKVMDFGIAKFLQSSEEGHTDLTGTGMTLGTAAYMSPEQVRGEPVDFRSDLYAVGGILHELITGETPFVADTRMKLMLQHMTKPAPVLPDVDVEGAHIPQALRDLHASLLSKHRYDRPGTSALVVDIFKAVARGEDIDAAGLLAAQHQDDGDGMHTRPVDGEAVFGMADTTALPRAAGPVTEAEPASVATAAAASWQGPSETTDKPNRAVWIAVAAAVLLGWGGLGAWFLFSSDGDDAPTAGDVSAEAGDTGDDKEAEEEPEKGADEEAEPTIKPAAEKPVTIEPSAAEKTVEIVENPTPKPAAEPTPAAKAEPEPKPEPEPAATTIVVRSSPAATVKDGRVELGKTPLTLTVPTEGPRVLTLSKYGYRSKHVTVRPGATVDVGVKLDPKPRAKKKEATGAGKW